VFFPHPSNTVCNSSTHLFSTRVAANLTVFSCSLSYKQRLLYYHFSAIIICSEIQRVRNCWRTEAPTWWIYIYIYILLFFTWKWSALYASFLHFYIGPEWNKSFYSWKLLFSRLLCSGSIQYDLGPLCCHVLQTTLLSFQNSIPYTAENRPFFKKKTFFL
jgi:hypothetical protein